MLYTLTVLILNITIITICLSAIAFIAREIVNNIIDYTMKKDSVEGVEISDDEAAYRQAQQYDIENFRNRMNRMRQVAEVDENGLFDAPIVKTREELGFTTGVELPPGE